MIQLRIPILHGYSHIQPHATMTILTFTLSEEGVTAFRDALNCLSKFSEDVSIEARKDSVRNHLITHFITSC